MSESRFYICEKCGNTVGMIHDKGVPLYCCGVQMKHLDPKKSDFPNTMSVTKAADEVCVNVRNGDTGDGQSWVYLQTDRGGQRKCIGHGKGTTVRFTLCDEQPRAVYAYSSDCGLCKTEL